MGKPVQSELTKLRITVAKGAESELLEGNLESSILSTSLSTSLAPIGPASHLSSEHLQLLTAVLKRLASFLRPSTSPSSESSTSCLTSKAVALSESILIAEKQLEIGQLLSTALDSSHRGLSSDGSTALDAFVSLAGALQTIPTEAAAASDRQQDAPILAPLALQALSSALLTKPPLLLLSSLLPTLPTSFLQSHAPNLLQQLLQQSTERHLAQPRGKLLAVLVGHHLDAPPSSSLSTSSDLQTSLLRALLIDDPILRLNINQSALRPLAEKHPRFIADLVNRLVVAGGGGRGGREGEEEEEFARHEKREEAWLSLVTLGNAISLCEDIAPAGKEKEGGGEKIALPLDAVLGCLSHPSSAVKLGAFSLVTDKPAINSPLSEGEVVVVKKFLEAAINTGESDFRHSVVGRVGKLVVRIKASTFASNRDLAKLRALADPKTPAELVLIAGFGKTLGTSLELLVWLTTFLTSQIRPAASHSRIILSLRLLQGLFASDLFSDISSSSSTADAPSQGSKTQRALPQTFPFQLVYFTPPRVRSFVGCLLSTYAEVRILAIELLEQGPSSLPGLDTAEKIESLDKEARGSYLSNPRGSQGHAGALALRLVFGLRFGLGRGKEVDLGGQAAFVNVLLDDIDFRLQLSKTNVILASSSHPVHGLLQALQEILALLDPPSFPEVFHRTLRTVALSWECTRDVLSSTAASTAGADDEVVPDHEIARAIAKAGESKEEESSSGGESGPVYQIILSWAWRAVKESSALLSAILVRPLQDSFKNKTSSIWTSSHLQEGGQLFIALLSEIRHPGAFLHIYPEYSKLVEAIVRNTIEKEESFRRLPEEWLKLHLKALNVEHHTAGRRSAGLPFGTLAVLLGQPKLVPSALEALLKLSTSESSEVVVTAMNALKVVMSESKLSSFVSPFFEQAVITSLESLSSPDWAVRNVGLLLMGALVRKAFDAKSQASESILSRDSLSAWSRKYPRLLPLFLRELRSLELEDKLKRSEGSVFAILQVLRNLQASDPPSEEQTAFVAVLERLSASRQLDVREAAAHALPAVISRSSLRSYLPQAIAKARSSKTQNELHGRLLQLLVLVQNVARPFDPVEEHQDFVHALIESIPSLLLENRCPPTRGLFVQLVGAVKIASGENFKGRTFVEVDRFCQDRIESRQPSSGTAAPVGDDLLKLACARYVLDDPTTDRFEALLRKTDEVAEIALLQLDDQDEPLPPPLANLISPIAFAKSASQRCRQPALRLLSTLSFCSSLEGDASTRWDGLMEEFVPSTCQPFKEALLPVLGSLAQGSDSETTSTRLARMLEIVETSSEETESEDMRFAALTSLSNFTPTLFSTSVPLHAYTLRIRGHRLVLRLLQDDEYGVRLLAATLVGRVLGIRNDGLDQEVALQKWWDHISEQGRGQARWKEELWRMIEGGMSDALDLDALRATSVLFATEAPNTFREPELDIRAAASSLGEEVGGGGGGENDDEKITTLRSAVSEFSGALRGEGDLWLDPASAVLHLRSLQVRLVLDALRKGRKGEGEEVLELEKLVETCKLDV